MELKEIISQLENTNSIIQEIELQLLKLLEDRNTYKKNLSQKMKELNITEYSSDINIYKFKKKETVQVYTLPKDK
jgi:hypothetical protein